MARSRSSQSTDQPQAAWRARLSGLLKRGDAGGGQQRSSQQRTTAKSSSKQRGRSRKDQPAGLLEQLRNLPGTWQDLVDNLPPWADEIAAILLL
ncbi:MAG: hypothetical protein JW910_04410, partial [Anaerolineae bacterium]|nr:hypothetical protein [Anaerolineae bacterium]